ncbi:MAG: EAL domain-containing protein [Proteobacteria bacterium]|nr:EAL domain-containing protein [Pseudomonadota bacterium]
MDSFGQNKAALTQSEDGLEPVAEKRWLNLAYSPSRIWQSRISWRITTTVFVTILLIQTVVLIFTVRVYEGEHLERLREIAHTALAPALNNTKEQTISPLTREAAARLFTDTMVEGIAIYGLDYSVIQTYGAPTLLQPKMSADMPASYRSVDNKHYEVLFAPGEIGHPYNIVARMNAADVEPHVIGHIHQTLWILFFMSGLVTSILMLILSLWLLEPMILLRNNLLSAAKNPEAPDIKNLKKDMQDEIGIAIRIANDLIRQNANNLKRLRTQAEDRIHRLAYFDGLTGLPNRTFFLEKLNESIKQKVVEQDGKIAVISVDIDHFKDINDTMGHEIGDKLLEAVGKRIVKSLPEDAVVARASADEFSIMVHLKPEQPDSAVLVERIFTAMVEPVSILQERFQVRVSVGVAHCPDDGLEARQILKNADIAVNRAKEEGRDTVRYYSQDFDRAIQQRFQLLRDLRIAMDQKQLRLHYHPQFDLKTGQVIGVEALLRWWRPDNSKEGGKFIPPVEFIPVAEQSGLIVPIGEYVMREACEANKRWQQRGLPPFRMAVNISGVQFHRGDIVSIVDTVLKETQLDPRWLELEVTESVFMENMQIAIDILGKLHQLGVELAVDDFGTGYSSLSYLRQFPIDRLKIDQSFIRSALTNIDDRMIVRIIITLGHNLGLKVIAEGVETSDHENFLKEEGCDEVQGFKYTKPIPEEELLEFLVAHNRAIAKNSKLSVIE